MNLGMLSGIIGLGEGIIKLVDQVIPDKDKAVEYKFKILDRMYTFYEKVLSAPTIPWVDALIKFILVGKEFLRPVGSFILSAGTIYLYNKGIEIPEYIAAPMAAAFPGWMYSRHKEKNEKPNWSWD